MSFITKKIVATVVVLSVASVSFTGCTGAISTAIKKRNLDVQTKMSDTVFLDPVAPQEQIVYVKIRNTSDKDIEISEQIKNAFSSHGFMITQNPHEAKFMVQANLLRVGKSDAREAQSALVSGFGGAIVGGVVGAATSRGGVDFSSKGALIGSLIGAGLSMAGDALVEDTFYTMITDVEIRQRPFEDEVVTQTLDTEVKQGSSSNLNQVVSSGNVKWKIYRTRIVSTANKVNLDFVEAKSALVDGLTKSISGLL